jgi:polyhydroxyalkanoate synthesis regulator phasin
MQDAWRAYLELATGLTEASRRRAEQVARDLIGRGETTATQVQAFVEDLVSTSRANRESLVNLVRYEVDRALGAVGLATADEVSDLTKRVRKLERELQQAEAGAAPAAKKAAGKATKAPAKKAAKSTARKAPAKKAAKKTAKKAARKQTAKKAGATQGRS